MPCGFHLTLPINSGTGACIVEFDVYNDVASFISTAADERKMSD